MKRPPMSPLAFWIHVAWIAFALSVAVVLVEMTWLTPVPVVHPPVIHMTMEPNPTPTCNVPTGLFPPGFEVVNTFCGVTGNLFRLLRGFGL